VRATATAEHRVRRAGAASRWAAVVVLTSLALVAGMLGCSSQWSPQRVTETTYSIAGTVTDASTSSRLSGVVVAFGYRYADSTSVEAESVTDSLGAFGYWCYGYRPNPQSVARFSKAGYSAVEVRTTDAVSLVRGKPFWEYRMDIALTREGPQP
jgi:hypothetical protein